MGKPCSKNMPEFPAPSSAHRGQIQAARAPIVVPKSTPTTENKLFMAAKRGDQDALTAVLQGLTRAQRREAINSRDANGFSPLLYCAMNGHTECALACIREGADTAARDPEGMTAVMLSARYDRPSTLKELLKHGNTLALLEARDNEQNTALLLAAQHGKLECLRECIRFGKKLEDKLRAQCDKVVQGASETLAAQDFPDLVVGEMSEFVGREGCSQWLEARNLHGDTALLLAAQNGDLAMLTECINSGADVNAKNHRGQTALHLTVVERHEECRKLLTALPSVDQSAKDEDGFTAGNLLLVQYTAEVARRNKPQRLAPPKKVARIRVNFNSVP